MTITTTTLTRATGLAAVAGACCSSPSSSTPHLDAAFTTTTEWAVRETMKNCMAVLSLIGITGMYLRQVRQTGVLGLVGYVVLGFGYLAIMSLQVVGVFALPDLAASQPGYVNDVFAVATAAPRSATSAGADFHQLGGIAYIVGGIIFGIALFRAGILARWAAALIAVGAVATVATFLVPETVQRMFALPVSVALVGLGYSLWREQRTQAVRPVASTESSSLTRPAQGDHQRAIPRSDPDRDGGVGAVRPARPARRSLPSPALFGWSSWPEVRSFCRQTPA